MIHPTLTRLQVTGLHGHQSFDIHLKSGLNIIHGRNGSGKTTALHIIANLLEHDLSRFLNLRFESIAVETTQGDSVQLRQHRMTSGTTIEVSLNESAIGTVNREVGISAGEAELLADRLGARPVYLPAFRSVLEAISRESNRVRHSQDVVEDAEYRAIVQRETRRARSDERRSVRSGIAFPRSEAAQAIAYKTQLCRDWFSRFVPVIRCPSLREVARELSRELTAAEIEVAESDSTAFANVFVDVLRAVLDVNTLNGGSGGLQAVLGRIQESLAVLNTGQAAVPAVYAQISSLIHDNAQHLSLEEAYVARILNVYEDAFNERVRKQQSAFARIEVFEQSVNRFLQGKKLHVRGHERRYAPGPAVGSGMITLPNGRTASLNALSSGERQVMTLLFSATHLSSYDGMVLIDEPELSLHVGWQRIILDELLKQAEDRQIIVCTHAPEITANHRERTIRFAPTIWRDQGPDAVDGVDSDIDVI